jgi:hypothetical protein
MTNMTNEYNMCVEQRRHNGDVDDGDDLSLGSSRSLTWSELQFKNTDKDFSEYMEYKRQQQTVPWQPTSV